MKPISQMDEEAASGLGARLVAKVDEVIDWISRFKVVDDAWKTEAEQRLTALEREVAGLKAQNRGLKIAKGKAISGRNKALEAQVTAEAKLAEARRLLN